MLIPLAQPLDLLNTLESGQAFRWRREGPANEWHRGVIFNNLVWLRQAPDAIEFKCRPDDEKALWPLVHEYLGLRDDLDEIYGAMRRDPRLAESVGRFPGMRILRQEPWECLASFICSANSNIPRITANVEDISTSFGRAIDAGDGIAHAFPSPRQLAEAGEQRLRDLGLGFRAKYLAAAARIVANGAVDLLPLREAAYEEALEALTELPGVGDKVANCVLLFALDKAEAFPVDVWVHRVLEEWYLNGQGSSRKLNRLDMRRWAQDRFKPYAGYASQYLFHDRRLQGRRRS